MSHAGESSRSNRSAWVNLLMISIFLLLISFAMWLVWVTYFREHYDAGIIEIKYTDGMVGTVTGGEASARGMRFHNETSAGPTGESLSACVVCHSEHPHNASKSVRAYLNAHAYVMTCEVCHLELEHSIVPTYRWLDEKSNTVSNNRASGERKKIIPIQYKDGEIKRFDEAENLEAIRQYVKEQSTMTDAFRQAMVKETHVAVSKEATSCHECHNVDEPTAQLYRDLAYEGDRVWELQKIEVAGMIHKYEEFYMPSLLRDYSDTP